MRIGRKTLAWGILAAAASGLLLAQTKGPAPGGGESKIRGVSADIDGSIEAIPGIEGIDSITLQNLEAVLRMQQPPDQMQNTGGARTAASLMMNETTETFEEIPDAREEHMEFEMEGS